MPHKDMKLTRISNQLFSLLLVATLTFTISCGPGKGTESTAEEETKEEVKEISLTKAPASPAYENASLDLNNVKVLKGDSTYSASFDFKVENYDLGAQTEGADTRGIANSGKGQHIHFIVNNGPYSAHYESGFSKDMEEGNYVLLAFLSRSYHESVKNPDAFWIDLVTVGEPEETMEVDFTAPHMFYSRPKGTYSGADTEKVMLDFYLLNTTISPDGNKVKATINGKEFMIDEWAPYYIENAPKGTLNVKLQLIDSEGNAIPGPFNTVERDVTLN